MEKLELKHLSAYLPYGLKGFTDEKIEFNDDSYIPKGVYLISLGNVSDMQDERKLELIKPILRPLSDLTKEIQIAEYYMSFINHLNRLTGLSIDLDLDIDVDNFFGFVDFSNLIIMNEFLFSYSFDVFGLIDKGLAIDINTLKK